MLYTIYNTICLLAYIAMCDFETDSCGWNDDDTNKYIWQRQKGKPRYPYDGPNIDHSTTSGEHNILLVCNLLDKVYYGILNGVCVTHCHSSILFSLLCHSIDNVR